MGHYGNTYFNNNMVYMAYRLFQNKKKRLLPRWKGGQGTAITNWAETYRVEIYCDNNCAETYRVEIYRDNNCAETYCVEIYHTKIYHRWDLSSTAVILAARITTTRAKFCAHARYSICLVLLAIELKMSSSESRQGEPRQGRQLTDREKQALLGKQSIPDHFFLLPHGLGTRLIISLS